MGLYDNPKIVKRVMALVARGLSRPAIGNEVGLSKSTVRKILDPSYAERERERLRAVDQARAPRWQHEAYRDYQIAYGATPERREQVRDRMRQLRKERS